MEELIQLARDYPLGLALLVALASVVTVKEVVRRKRANGHDPSPYEKSFVERADQWFRRMHKLRGWQTEVELRFDRLERHAGLPPLPKADFEEDF
jgi:hypothetical protein